MAETAVVPRLAKAAKSYVRDVADLIASGSTTEATYYPAVRSLIVAALSAEDLPFDVRINTSEQKTGGGVNLPDIALYDADGEFLVVCGEVKLPAVELEQLAISTENQGSNRALSRGDTRRSDMQRAGIRARDRQPKVEGRWAGAA